jgi:uncharacterized membrane protein
MINRTKNFLLKDTFLFLVGGDIYILIEIGFRGYSHWTMFVLGGICFLSLGYINRFLPWTTPLPVQMLIGMGIITVLELITGLVVNVYLGWNVWDYSNMPFNLLGQICLLASAGWYMLSVVGIVLDDYLRYWIFHEDKPHYRII